MNRQSFICLLQVVRWIVLHNFHFTQYKAVHLSISFSPILTWVCYLPHWSASLYEWPNEAKEREEEICPPETRVNQCDIFTSELRWACRPHFSGWQRRPLWKERQTIWTVNTSNTQTVDANNTMRWKSASRFHSGWIYFSQGCAEWGRGQGNLQSIHQSSNWFNHLAVMTRHCR